MTNKPCWEEKLLLFKKLEKESVHLLKRELVIVYQTINNKIYGLLSAAFPIFFMMTMAQNSKGKRRE